MFPLYRVTFEARNPGWPVDAWGCDEEEELAENKLNRADWIQVVSLIVVCVWSTSPPLLINEAARLAALGCIGLWFAVELFKHPDSFLKPSPVTLVTLFFLIFSNGLGIYTDKNAAIKWLLPPDICLMFLLVQECHQRRGVKILRPVFWSVIVVNLAWTVITLIRMGSQRNVARIVTRASEQALQLQAEGVGGFALIYFALIVVPICLYLVRHRVAKTRLTKFLLWASLILSSVLILKGGYAFAPIILLIAIPFSLLLDRPTPKSLIRTTAVIAFVVPLILFSVPLVTGVLTEATRGTMYERKVRDIIFSIENSDTVGTVNDRTNRYSVSLEALASNPVVGVLSYNKVGKHSAILDRLAEYGVFFGSSFIYLLIALPLRYMRRRQSLAFGLSVTIAIVALTFASVNNIFPAFGVALFILFPVAVDYAEELSASTTAPERVPVQPVLASPTVT